MPRFHFNDFDERSAPDMEGTELTDHHAARREAVRLAAALLSDERFHPRDAVDWRLEVTNDVGLILYRVDFSLSASAAVSGSDSWREAP